MPAKSFPFARQPLDLRSNSLTSLDPATFSTLRNLNSLLVLPHFAAQSPTLVIRRFLNSNSITSLPSGIFSNNIFLSSLLPQLHRLQLSVLSSQSSVGNLNSNRLASIQQDVLSPLKYLISLHRIDYTTLTIPHIPFLLHQHRFQLHNTSRHG